MNNATKNLKEKISELGYTNIWDFDDDFILNITNSIIKNLNLHSEKEYLIFLKNNKSEINKFTDALYNGYTEFFRGSLNFSLLEKVILPELIYKKQLFNEKEIRIWSVAASSGQEPYSISMLCYEIQELHKTDVKFSIFATDIIETKIKTAQLGIYKENCLNNLTVNRLNKFFIKQNDRFYLKNEIKENVHFSIFDLTNTNSIVPENCVFGSYDIIFCSNVLIYYNQSTRQHIISKLLNSLSKDGYIICDESETFLLNQSNLKLAYPKSSVFQKYNNY